MVALAYSFALGCYDYSDRRNETPKNKTLDIVCYFLTTLFLFEVLINIIALGLWSHKTSYFRSAWNVYDFIVLIALY